MRVHGLEDDLGVQHGGLQDEHGVELLRGLLGYLGELPVHSLNTRITLINSSNCLKICSVPGPSTCRPRMRRSEWRRGRWSRTCPRSPRWRSARTAAAPASAPAAARARRGRARAAPRTRGRPAAAASCGHGARAGTRPPAVSVDIVRCVDIMTATCSPATGTRLSLHCTRAAS